MLGGEQAVKFLNTTDPFERSILQALARDTREIQRRHDNERATQISNAVMKGLGAK